MQWTWTWANSGRWWRTGRPGVLQSMGLPRVGHDWATEQQQQGPVIQSVVWTSSSDVTWVCWPQMSNLRSHPRPYYKIVLTRCSSDLFCMLKFKKQFRKLLGCCIARKSGILAISPKTNICFTNVSFTYFCSFSVSMPKHSVILKKKTFWMSMKPNMCSTKMHISS